ncbi:MAG: EpsI family protein [Phenylobacterium sp. RIFCSPHIGHO2_01_FULL_69_31]|uniref:exosortase-associated protein EpsI, V-type n=1 Tax=Phenylobacterium sp. RIFCSPHIGHO2_01_FULL_69_31 TaxID=1801944 RepID=UPI0008B094AD|nr:exosortase-associated protein EpsI, V-type [Phenylobacterium sp. RIFCSPHIGHO2_01_FULL_69_31]OHB26407.1 MAG: EpsI family protein [Phenylobacterium sp. RIFCSPHIGHO2_01_FULL_69_31]
MIDRRLALMGGLGVAALAASEALRPRRHLVLLKKGTIEEAVPTTFGNWTAHAASDLVSPEQAGRLANSLYSELVSRAYLDEETGTTAFALLAYGDTQSDLLQLHRPESCYPAVGFTLQMTKPLDLPIGGTAVLPSRQVTATLEDRVENILYWTRLGERLPQGGGEQRTARLQNAMEGYVADGILARFSVVGDPRASFEVLGRFVPALLQAIPAERRAALIGTDLSRRMA